MTFKLDIQYHAIYILSGDVILQIRHLDTTVISTRIFRLRVYYFKPSPS